MKKYETKCVVIVTVSEYEQWVYGPFSFKVASKNAEAWQAAGRSVIVLPLEPKGATP